MKMKMNGELTFKNTSHTPNLKWVPRGAISAHLVSLCTNEISNLIIVIGGNVVIQMVLQTLFRVLTQKHQTNFARQANTAFSGIGSFQRTLVSLLYV